MIAYDTGAIRNLFIQQQTEEGFADGMLGATEWVSIKIAHPFSLFVPRFVLRAGFFILTFIVIFFFFGFLILLFRNSLEDSLAGICIVFSIACFSFLEYFIKRKKHFRAGTDDVLLYAAVVALLGGFYELFSMSEWQLCITGAIVTSLAGYRYTDRLMGLTAFCFLAGTIFFGFDVYSSKVRLLMPWMLMCFSLIVYFIFKRFSVDRCHYFYPLSTALQIAGLAGFYIAGNYFTVKEFNADFTLAGEQSELSSGFVYWMITVVVPLIYMLLGFRLKDILLLRVGILLLAIAIWIMRYYNAVIPIESFLALLGGIMIIAGWFFIKKLAGNKMNFTSDQQKPANDIKQVEAVVIAETMPGTGASPSGTQFGGGSFGGGGSSGDY